MTMKRYFEPGMAYFVTTVTDQRKPIFIDPKLCRIFLITVEYYKTILDYKVLGYCLMPDHFHLIIKPAEKFNLSFIMKMVKGSFTRKINRLNGRLGSLWQRQYYEEAVRNEKQLLCQLDYMHANPVSAGLVENAEQYRYSSFGQYHDSGNKDVILEIDDLNT